MRQLDGGTWAPWLPRGWKEAGNDLSAGVEGVSRAGERESGAGDVTGAVAPDVRNLQPILTALAGAGTRTVGRDSSRGFRSISSDASSRRMSWFSRMVSHVGVSQSVIRLITYGSLLRLCCWPASSLLMKARTRDIPNGAALRAPVQLAALAQPRLRVGVILKRHPLRDRPPFVAPN